MMSATDHPLVADYLHRLASAASTLPTEQAAELSADIREHLAAATAEAQGSEAALREALDRLGSPEDLVREATGSNPAALTTPHRESTRLEDAGLALFGLGYVLTLTIFLAYLGLLATIAGFVILIISRRWTAGDKALGGVVLGVLAAPFLWLLIFSGAMFSTVTSCAQGQNADGTTWESCTGGAPGWLTPVAWIALVAVPALAAYTIWRLYRRIHPAA